MSKPKSEMHVSLIEIEKIKDITDVILLEKSHGKNDIRVVLAYNQLGNIHRVIQPEKAKQYYESALKGVEQLYGSRHPDVWSILNKLSVICETLKENEEAKKYRERLAEINAEQKYETGLKYYQGKDGFQKDLKKAAEFYQSSAQYNYVPAQLALGLMYQFGVGIKTDFDRAFKLLEAAAEKGSIEAKFRLAECYFAGQGVAKSEKQAVNLYKQAEVKGHMAAKYFLAECHEKGTGVVVDLDLAKTYYEEAKKGGYVAAQKALDRLAASGKNSRSKTH